MSEAPKLDRRNFLRSAITVAAATSVSTCGPRFSRAGEERGDTGVFFDPWPFSLGVASGDPREDRVILWTKLGAEELDGRPHLAKDCEVEWLVARDLDFRSVVRRGTVLARVEAGHAIRIDVDGLEPATTYWYRFRALGATSRVGRTRTTDSRASRARLALVSCANFTEGYFGAYHALAGEALDAVVCTGDYYYERHSPWGAVRGDDQSAEVFTVEEYRRRISLYRGDPDLRAAHAAHPWIVAWDDHEVVNDYAGLEPIASDGGIKFEDRRRAAYQAFFEMMPIRSEGPDFFVHRRFAFGDLVDLFVLDTRQFREGQSAVAADAARFFACDQVAEAPGSILGSAQREWLEQGIATSKAAWRVVAQQVMMAALRIGGRADTDPDRGGLAAWLLGGAQPRCFNPDQWDGYPADRRKVLELVARQEIPDVVVLTGDMHMAMFAELKADFDDAGAPPAAIEIVGPSIASTGLPRGSNGPTRSALYAANPHLRYLEGEQRGYVVVDVGRDGITASVRAIDDVTRRRPTSWTSSEWRIPRGRSRIESVRG